MPTPSTAIATSKSAVSICGSIVAEQEQRRRPAGRRSRRARSSRGEKRVARRAPATAVTSSVTEVGSMRIPVSQRVEALHDLQVERDREEDPHQHEVLAEERHSPLRSDGRASSAKCTSGLRRAPPRGAPRRGRPPAARRRRRRRTASSEKPNGSIGELRGASQPHLLAFSTPKTIRPSPSALRLEPTQSSRGAGPSRGRVAHEPRRREHDPGRDHDLAGEHEPPASARSSASRRGSGRRRSPRPTTPPSTP